MRFTSRLGCCLAAGIPVVVLAACSSGGASGGASGPSPEVSSVVLDTVPTGDTAGIYIARDDGYFARQGLAVKIVPVGGAQYGMGDLQAGRAQLIEGNYVSFILAQTAGRFAAPSPANARVTEPSKPISMRIIADTSQMQPGNQALYVMPGAPYKTVPDLDQGSLQNFPIGTVAGNTSWVLDPATVAAFLRALEQGQQIADTDRAAVEQALVRNGVAPSAEIAATMTFPTYPLAMDVPVMQRVPDAIYELGVTGACRSAGRARRAWRPRPGSGSRRAGHVLAR